VQASDILLRNLDDSGLLRLTLNDPARRNALSEAMLGELGAAFADAGKNPPVRVVILAANGLAFCAGHDLKEMTAGPDRGRTYFSAVMTMCSGVMQAIVNCRSRSSPRSRGLQPRLAASWLPAAIFRRCDHAAVQHARGSHWAVLLHAHGRPVAQRQQQVCNGDAADWGHDIGLAARRRLGSSTGSSLQKPCGRPRWRWPARSHPSRA
jgi:hypothetical protein